MSCELGSSISFSSWSTVLCCNPIPSSNAYKKTGPISKNNITFVHSKDTAEDITVVETYTLCCGQRDISELLEEKDACHCWDQVHDQVVVHHAPRIQLQTFEVVGAEMACQLGAAESCEGQRHVSSGR